MKFLYFFIKLQMMFGIVLYGSEMLVPEEFPARFCDRLGKIVITGINRTLNRILIEAWQDLSQFRILTNLVVFVVRLSSDITITFEKIIGSNFG